MDTALDERYQCSVDYAMAFHDFLTMDKFTALYSGEATKLKYFQN